MKQGFKFSLAEIDTLKQNWKKFADENKGTFEVIRMDSCFGDLRKFKMNILFYDKQIEFITDEFKPLKISYHFSKTYNEFLIYPEDFTDRIGKLFGLKEIETRNAAFDKKFFVKANNKDFIINLLNTQIIQFMLTNHISNFKFENTKDGSVLEMNVVINVLEIRNLIVILQLFKNLIDYIKQNDHLP